MEGNKTKGEERKTDLSLLLKRPSNMPRYAGHPLTCGIRPGVTLPLVRKVPCQLQYC